MKKLIAFLLFAASFSHAQTIDGKASDLAKACRTAMQEYVGSTSTWESGQSAYNTGLCMGTVRTWFMLVDGYVLDNGRVLHTAGNVKVSEMIQEFLEFMQQNPEYADKSSIEALLAAGFKRGWIVDQHQSVSPVKEQ
jgi:hypothetical protein